MKLTFALPLLALLSAPALGQAPAAATAPLPINAEVVLTVLTNFSGPNSARTPLMLLIVTLGVAMS